MEQVSIEAGTYGRLIMARLKPNRDLIESLEEICRENDIDRAIVRSALGSLVDGRLTGQGGKPDQVISGPGVEILNVTGEIAFDSQGRPVSVLSGMVAGTDGQVYAGKFVRGGNLAFITIEVSIQEWVPA
jgi:predicted DNA-binding protein with PD1-like motif